MSALEAITEAQKIAFAPMLFQVVVVMLRHGILAYLDQQGQKGASLQDVQSNVRLSDYAVRLLLDVAVSAHIVVRDDNECYVIDKVGHFLLHDKMTRVNLDFSQDVCYQGMFYLDESFQKSVPCGLQVFGPWRTIYPALSQLPSQAKESWFAFDHFYSDGSYEAALPYILELEPELIYDVGGNTGKFALKCCEHDENVRLTIIDLPQQVELSRANVAQHGLSERIGAYATNMLDDSLLPGDADIWWMSQFLDCFSEEEVVSILKKIHLYARAEARVCILELFPDLQPFEAGEFSLNAASLYFTTMANGNSRFYYSDVFLKCIEKAGFVVEKQINGLGIGHSLLICRKAV